MMSLKWAVVLMLLLPTLVPAWFHYPEEGEDKRRFCGRRLSTALMILCNPDNFYPPESIDRWVVRRRPITTTTSSTTSTTACVSETTTEPLTLGLPETIFALNPNNTSEFKPKTNSVFKSLIISALMPNTTSELKSTPDSVLKSGTVFALKPNTTSTLKPNTNSVLKLETNSLLKPELTSSLESEKNNKAKDVSTFKPESETFTSTQHQLPGTPKPLTVREEIARKRRGVVDECCRRACTIEQLSQWCG